MVIDSKAEFSWTKTKQKEIIFTNGKQRQLTLLLIDFVTESKTVFSWK